MAKEKKSRKSGKSTGMALALWIVLALVLFILFIINWNTIMGNLKDTGFFGKVFGKTPAFVEQYESKEKENVVENDVAPLPPNSGNVIIDLNGKANVTGEESNPVAPPAVVESSADVDKKDNKTESKTETKAESKTETKIENKAEEKTNSTAAAPAQTVVKTMNIKLYFMQVRSDGSVARHEVVRSMKKSDSPLVDSINALISGPNSSEASEGCRTLVSSNTRLLSAGIRSGVATLNFSGEFETNTLGIEGLRGQLEQIVYTATAFPTVDSVQFLIDGEKKQFLGEEGVWIGTPLDRNSF